MDPAKALDYVRENTNAVLATMRRDGTPQMSPVTLAVVDDTVVMSTRETAYKTKNLCRDPRSWLCVFPPQLLRRLGADRVPAPRSSPARTPWSRWSSTTAPCGASTPDWDEYRQAMVDDQRCLVKFHIQRAGPDRSG